VNVTLMLLSVALLVAGLALHLWSSRPARVGRRHTILVPVLLMYALGATILIFSLFPDSLAHGTILGFTVGGAAAFALLVWALAIRWTRPAEDADCHELEIARLTAEVDRLRSVVEGSGGAEVTAPVEQITLYEYRLRHRKDATVGVLCGNLRNVRDVDVWVNTENTNMEMSRQSGRTISALIRHYGSRRDAQGRVLADTVHDDLVAAVAGRTPVPACTVITTGPGELAASNGVQRIVHVATVEAAPVSGYRPVLDLNRCATNALNEVARINRDEGVALRSVVLPLFGAGTGGGDPRQTATVVFDAVIGFLAAHPQEKPSVVYLLAHTQAKRLIFVDILDGRADLAPVGRRRAAAVGS
jgi:O-acetyl-ADP-ribose deacetylase (regulator of RNase III)